MAASFGTLSVRREATFCRSLNQICNASEKERRSWDKQVIRWIFWWYCDWSNAGFNLWQWNIFWWATLTYRYIQLMDDQNWGRMIKPVKPLQVSNAEFDFRRLTFTRLSLDYIDGSTISFIVASKQTIHIREGKYYNNEKTLVLQWSYWFNSKPLGNTKHLSWTTRVWSSSHLSGEGRFARNQIALHQYELHITPPKYYILLYRYTYFLLCLLNCSICNC